MTQLQFGKMNFKRKSYKTIVHAGNNKQNEEASRSHAIHLEIGWGKT